MTDSKRISFDVGDLCVNCGCDTSYGSGLFVNRIPAETDRDNSAFRTITTDDVATIVGYLCPKCQEMECDVCGEVIELGEEILDGRVYCPRCYDLR